MNKNSNILITGGTGLVGTNLKEYFIEQGYKNVTAISSKDCNLSNLEQTLEFFQKTKPEYVFHCAGYIHGIMGNMKFKGNAFFKNTCINLNTVEACHQSKVKKIVAMGTGAVYSQDCSLPLNEDDIWQGPPHHSEDAYAHSKRAMYAQLCAYKENYGMDFAFVVSANLYGPHDNFDTEHGHVIPALIKKFYDASKSKSKVTVWGNGTAERDFIHANDFVRALEFIMLKDEGAINMASGSVSSIRDIVNELSDISGVTDIEWDKTKPNGQKHRSYDLNKLFALGFKSQTTIKSGLKETFEWYQENVKSSRSK